MTARQRAMFDRKTDNKEFIEELVALPSGMEFNLIYLSLVNILIKYLQGIVKKY